MSISSKPDASRGVVDIVTPYIAHYRVGVFRALSRGRRLDYRVVSGLTCSPRDPMPVAPPTGAAETVANYWFGRFLVQPGAIRLAATTPAMGVILVGDARHLSTWLAVAILRLRGKQAFLWTIGWHRPDSGIRRLIRLCFYSLASELLLYGEDARLIGRAMGFDVLRMAVIGNSHDVEVPPPVWRLKAPARRRVVGAVVRVQPSRRFELLIEAVSELNRGGSPVSIVIVGDGPCVDDLKRLASDMQVDVAFVSGAYDRQLLEDVYGRIDVTVVPEAMGLTAVQSLWYGTPIITCDDATLQRPESAAVVPGVTGDFYQTGSSDALRGAIETWLDRVAADAIGVGEVCRSYVMTHWSADAHAARIDTAVYEQFERERRARH